MNGESNQESLDRIANWSNKTAMMLRDILMSLKGCKPQNLDDPFNKVELKVYGKSGMLHATFTIENKDSKENLDADKKNIL